MKLFWTICLCFFSCFIISPPYHMMTVELFHHGRLVQKLYPLPHACWLVHRLDRHPCLRFILDDAFGCAFVHHAEGALPQLLVHGDLFPGHLPLIWSVHCSSKKKKVCRVNPTCTSIQTVQLRSRKKLFDILTFSRTDVLWVDRCIKDSIPKSVVVSGNTSPTEWADKQALVSNAIFSPQ